MPPHVDDAVGWWNHHGTLLSAGATGRASPDDFRVDDGGNEIDFFAAPHKRIGVVVQMVAQIDRDQKYRIKQTISQHPN